MKIPFLDLKRQLSGTAREDIDRAIEEVLDSGQLVGGDFLSRYEREFASYCGSDYGIGTGNGLDALYLSLVALDIGPGDQVIVPAHTYIATWLAVSRTGAEPVPVDVRIETGNIDERLIERAVTQKTRAIIVVHLYGSIPEMDVIFQISGQYNLVIVEDAAQSHGATYSGRRAGSLGTLAAFSFYPTKNLGAIGDAGIVTTDSKQLAEKVRALRDYGRVGRNDYLYKGVNSRLDPIQANVLYARLARLDQSNERKNSIANRYNKALGRLGYSDVRPLINGIQSVWHQYIVIAENRDAFVRALDEREVGTDIHYPIPPYRQPCYREEMHDQSAWPVADELASKVVSLPIGDYLTDDEVDYICNCLVEVVSDQRN